MEQVDVLVSDLGEDLLHRQRVQILIQVLQRFLDVGVHIATVLKLLYQIIDFLVFGH